MPNSSPETSSPTSPESTPDTSPISSPVESPKQQYTIRDRLQGAGFTNCRKITDTLQGSIWKANMKQHDLKSVVVKVTSRNLHRQKVTVVDGHRLFKVRENIKKEKAILKYLSKDESCPATITKYIGSFKTKEDYYLVEEDGGRDLLDFVVKAHKLIREGFLAMDDWHALAKLIFKQMRECIEYIHSKGVVHFDISLENWLINDLDCSVDPDTHKINFVIDDVKSPIRIRLCDFGLAERFPECDSIAANRFASNKHCGKTRYKSPEVLSQQKVFCAQSNDVWCLGVCLFMIVVGACPWEQASRSDECYRSTMNGELDQVLEHLNCTNHVDKRLTTLFRSFFVPEKKRVTLEMLKFSPWAQF